MQDLHTLPSSVLQLVKSKFFGTSGSAGLTSIGFVSFFLSSGFSTGSVLFSSLGTSGVTGVIGVLFLGMSGVSGVTSGLVSFFSGISGPTG
jgi:hypothetical protein